MSCVDDLWCDWCGRSNRVIYRYDDRVFCSFVCVRRYQASGERPSIERSSGER